MDANGAREIKNLGANDTDSGGACATGEGFSFNASFIGSNGERMIRLERGEVHIDPVRGKSWVVANFFPERRDIEGRKVRDKENDVRDTGVDEMGCVSRAIESEREIKTKIARLAEANADPIFMRKSFDNPIVHGNSLGKEVEISSKLNETSEAVAAAFSFAAIAVKDAHTKIGGRVKLKKDDAISANASLTIAKTRDKRRIEREGAIVD